MSAGRAQIRLLRSVCFLLATVALGGCAGAPPSSAPAPVAASPAKSAPEALPQLAETPLPPELGTVERYAWQRVLQLGHAFAAGDVDAFLGGVSHGFYRGYTTLEASLRAIMETSSARSAVVAVREVAADGDRVSVRAEWTRSVTRADGTTDARHGETVFLFLKSDTSLRLLDYRGASPFAIDGI